MISRRGLIAASGGLLLPAVAKALPVGFGQRPTAPAINLAHPMAANRQFSWLSTGQIGGYDLVHKVRGTVTGTPTTGALPWVGNVQTLATTAHVAFVDHPAIVENEATFWALINITSLAANQDLLSTSTGAAGWDFDALTAGQVSVRNIAAGTSFLTLPVSASIPYLIVISVNNLVVNGLVKRLDTSAVTTQSVAITTPTVSQGTYTMGAGVAVWNASACSYAAMAYSLTSMPLSQMLNAAADPWGPWRPDPGLPIEQMVAGGSTNTKRSALFFHPAGPL